MSCPHCGAETPAGLLKCPVCRGALVPSGGQYAVTALTPPGPFDATSLPHEPPADDTTGFPPSVTSTGFPVDAEAHTSAAPLADGETMLGGAPAARVEPGAYGPLQPGETFGTRYDIIRLLGAGGMGAVYQAWDRELGVALALKVVKPPADADATVARALEQRFKHELLLARQVTHKSVVRIHDLGEIGGVKYITMTYVDGEDLSTVLRTEGTLPVRRVLKIARQVIAGLAAAHEAGVVHRDLKPANIMIEADDQALIMDFGIAQSTTGPRRERHGSVVGTVAYMSPQQATGQPVDGRSDLYSFGLILYDLLGGRPPSQGGESAMADLLARIGNAPESIRALNPSVPEALDAVIMRCLQPSVEARYQSAAEVAAALDRLDEDGVPIPVPKVRRAPIIAVAAVLTMALSAGGWWLGRGSRAGPVQHEPVSVLIADVANTSGDPAFDNTFEQTLGIAIERAAFISVYPRKDARALAAKLSPGGAVRIAGETSQLIARSEGIKVVLAGSLAQRGNGFVVGVNVIDPANGKVLRTITSDASSRERVLPAVDTVAEQVRATLGETKTEAARLAGAETFTTASLAAMEAYARGQELNAVGKRVEAIQAYEEAIKADPQFGRAWAGMGVVYFNLKDKQKSEAAYQNALKYLGRMTEREQLRTLGGYYISVPRNYKKAIETYTTLVEKYPSDNVGYANLALAYYYVRDFKAATANGRKAVELSPNNTLQHTNLASYAMYAGDFQTAIAEADRVLKVNPNYDLAWLTRALSNLASGNAKAAMDDYTSLGQLGQRGALLRNTGEADLALSEGRFRDALRLLTIGIEAARRTNDTGALAQKYVAAAEASLALGQHAAAADYAAKAVSLSKEEAVLFPAALVLIHSGHEDAAQEIAGKLEDQLEAQTTSYAKLIDAETALAHRRFGHAIEAIQDGQKRYDSWFSRLLLGRAYMEAGPAHAAEALSEFDACLKRIGETTDAFLADTPTVRYLPPVYYWLGRAHDAVGSATDAKKNFEAFLIRRPTPDATDNLAADARRRVQ